VAVISAVPHADHLLLAPDR